MNTNLQAASAAENDFPKTVHFLGSLLTFRARAADTEGSFTVIESLTAPGAGAPPHRQADAEAFLVLEGGFEVMLGTEWQRFGPGEFVYIAPGVIHAFRNHLEQPSKMLIFNLPGGLHENFFLAVGDAIPAYTTIFPPMTPPDAPRLIETAMRYGVEILPPSA